MSIGVVVLNWNGKKDTLSCLSSLQESSYKNFETIVVDNGSTDDSVSTIQEKFPNVTLLETHQNLGYAGGNNVGISYSLKKTHSFVLLLNNDTIVHQDLLKNFIEMAGKHPEAGILGGWASLFSDPERLDHLGGTWNPKTGSFDLIGKGELNSFLYQGSLDYVCGCCILIRKEVFQKIGLLEEAYFLFWEEADFCIKAKRAGFDIQVCKEAKLLHKVSASFVGGNAHTTYFWWRGRLLWIKRNCSFKERVSLLLRVLIPQLFRTYKMFYIKNLELYLLKWLRSKKNLQEKHLKLKRYKAAIQGFHDYFSGRFGNAPEWIFHK